MDRQGGTALLELIEEMAEKSGQRRIGKNMEIQSSGKTTCRKRSSSQRGTEPLKNCYAHSQCHPWKNNTAIMTHA
jgi:hypothetical protein